MNKYKLTIFLDGNLNIEVNVESDKDETEYIEFFFGSNTQGYKMNDGIVVVRTEHVRSLQILKV